jgi:hypothetical protein
MDVGRSNRGIVAEEGQAVVGLLLVVAVLGAVLFALGRLGAAVIDTARAEAAADATALAALQAGPAAAQRVATHNGATLVAVRVVPGWAQVTVAVGHRRANATAALTPDSDP